MHSEFGYLNRMNLGFVNPVCLICNGSCTSNRICIQIFSEGNQLGTEKPLHMVMSEVLEREIQEETVHSTVICKKCYKIFEQVEELNHQVIDLKNNLIQNYKTSVEKFMKGEINASQSFIGESPDKDLHKEIENGDENGKSRNLLEMPSDDDQVVDGKILQGFGDLEKAFIREDCNVNDHSSSSETEYQTLPMQIKTESATSSESMERPNILRKKIILRRIKEDDEEERNKQNIVTANKGTSQDSTTFTCLLCPSDDAALYDARTIMQHVKATHDIRLYICDVCGMSFRKRTDLSAHLDEHVANEEGDFQCEICNRIFSNLRLFRIHKRMHYPQQKAWVCQTCGKKYSSKNLLEEHINTHTGVRPYICKQCGKDFASKYTFKAHEKTHSVGPRPFNCPKCHKTFLSQQNLTQHERTHLGIKDYACVVCGKQFGSAHNLEVHNIVHTGCKPFACGLCGKAFARKAEIRDHERTHTGERPYQCEFCGATFSQRSNLQSHKRATHYDDKRYKCESCGKGFKRRRLLDYHMKAAHTGERPFKCDVCEATFVYPEHFKKHRRIHTGEKPFLCEICGKAFNSRDNRNAHRFVHSDKKPYECLVCGAGFMRKPLLYQHMETQNHINDTIVVNQPRISPEDEQLVTINADGEMEIVDHVLVDGDLTSHNIDITSQTQDLSGDEPTHAIEHIIIDGEHIKFADEDIVETEDFQFQEVIARDTLLNGETQIMETPDGPIQLVKVRIPNENGEEEEAWIKIVAEEC